MPPNFDYWNPDSDWDPTQLGGGIVTETTLAALDQVCWHLLCCDFLFDVIEEESDVVFHQLAADVEQGRFRAEALFAAASRTYRTAAGLSARGPASAAVPKYSGAGAFLGACERQFEGDSPVIDGSTSPPTCQDVRGKNGSRRCARPALYLGEGQWSLCCDKHARRSDRERHERWRDARRASLDYNCYQRTQQRHAIGRAVLDWWRETGGPLTAMRDTVEHTGAGD
jgi:hypothetical protein